MKIYVLIGGPNDGQRMEVDDRLHRLRVITQSVAKGFEEDEYYRVRFRDSDGMDHEAFVSVSFKGSLMETLLENYRPASTVND